MTWDNRFNPLQVGPMSVGYGHAQAQVQSQFQTATQTTIMLTPEACKALKKMREAAAGWTEAQDKITRSAARNNELGGERTLEMEKPREQIDFAKVGRLTLEMELTAKDNTSAYLARGRARHAFDEAEHAFLQALRDAKQIPTNE